MGFDRLNRPELIKAASRLNVTFDMKDTKNDLVNRLEESGASWADYNDLLKAEAEEERERQRAMLNEGGIAVEEPAPVVEEDLVHDEDLEVKRAATKEEKEDVATDEDVLVKFVGKNRVYSVMGYQFGRDRPYAIVSNKDVPELTDRGLIRPATKQEVEDFYG